MTQQEFQQVSASLPALPGIYKYYDASSELLYVGKAKNIRKRVSSYFNKTLSSYKTHELVKRIRKIEFTIVNSEQDAFLLEATLRAGRHTVFARVEHVAKDELFADEALSHEIFEVQRLTAGYLFDLLRASHLAGGIGGLVSFIGIPESLSAAYDGQPVSYMVFVRAQIR